jgi:hypothetical protein
MDAMLVPHPRSGYLGVNPKERAKNIAKGIPESALGPSGKPKIHVTKQAQSGIQGDERGKPGLSAKGCIEQG